MSALPCEVQVSEERTRGRRSLLRRRTGVWRAVGGIPSRGASGRSGTKVAAPPNSHQHRRSHTQGLTETHLLIPEERKLGVLPLPLPHNFFEVPSMLPDLPRDRSQELFLPLIQHRPVPPALVRRRRGIGGASPPLRTFFRRRRALAPLGPAMVLAPRRSFDLCGRSSVPRAREGKRRRTVERSHRQ